jgi:hypothetical protein
MTPAILIAQAKVLAEQYLPDSCAIQELTTTNDGSGGFGESWNTIETVPGLVEAVDDMEAIVGSAPRGAVTQKLYLRVTTVTQALKPSQRVVVAPRDGKGELIFTQLKRLDESFETLITVAGVLDVSNPEESNS